MKKALMTALLCLCTCSALTVTASAQELVVGGQAVGIQVGTKGVIVAGLTQVDTAGGAKSPAQSAGMKKGDVIEKINGAEVDTASALIDSVAALDGASAELTVQRDGKTLRVTVQPVQNAEGQWMMGMWLRDSISGVGTVTFCDPESGIYGALGHSINDAESGAEIKAQMKIRELTANGKICESSVFDTVDEAERYAKRRGIPEVIVLRGEENA